METRNSRKKHGCDESQDENENNNQSRFSSRFNFRAEENDSHSGASVGNDRSEPHCVLIRMEDPQDGAPPQRAIWTNQVIPPATRPYTEDLEPITEAYVLTRNQALLFSGRRGKNEGMTEDHARTLAHRMTGGDLPWIGGNMDCRGRVLTLRAGMHRINETIRERRKERNLDKKDARDGQRRKPQRKKKATAAEANPAPSEAGDQPQRGGGSERSHRSNPPAGGGDGGGPPDDQGSDRGSSRGPPSSYGDGSDTASTRTGSIASSRHNRRRDNANQHRGGPAFGPGEQGKWKLRVFAGDSNTHPDSVSYRTWRFQVAVYQRRGARDADLLPRIINSLRGAPGEMLASLGVDVTVDAILQTLDNYYGNALSFDALATEMYSMSQMENETAGDYSTRVKDVVAFISELFPVQLPPETIPARLRERFYFGLRPKYRNALAYLKNDQTVTFHDLIKEARELEESALKHRQNEKKPHTTRRENLPIPLTAGQKTVANRAASRSARADLMEIGNLMEETLRESDSGGEQTGEQGEEEDPELDHVVSVMKSVYQGLKTKNYWDKFPRGDRKQTQGNTGDRKCFNCGGEGHFARECPSPKNPKTSATKNSSGERDTTQPSQAQSGSTAQKQVNSTAMEGSN